MTTFADRNYAARLQRGFGFGEGRHQKISFSMAARMESRRGKASR